MNRETVYSTPFTKMEVWSCFSEIWRKNVPKLFSLIVSYMERIIARKRSTIKIVHGTMILSKFMYDNFHISFQCHRSITKSIDIYFCYHERVHECSIVEIENLVVNPESQPVKSNSEQYQFLFKYVSSKNQWQHFSKFYFGVIFAQSKFSLKTLAVYNCMSPPAFKCQRFRVHWSSDQNHSITINMQKSFYESAQFIKSFVIYNWFKHPMIYKASPIFGYAHPVIIKVTFSFSKFVSACKNQLISSIYSWDTAGFWDPRPKRPHPFWPTPPQNYWSNFWVFSIFH